MQPRLGGRGARAVPRTGSRRRPHSAGFPQESTRQTYRGVVYWLSITANGSGLLWQISRAGPRSASARSTPAPSPQKLLRSQISTWPAGLASHSLSRKHVFSEHVTHWMGGPKLSINVGLGGLMETGFGEPCTQLGRGLQELPGGHPYNLFRILVRRNQGPQNQGCVSQPRAHPRLCKELVGPMCELGGWGQGEITDET